jgi:hypothetical protein
VVSAGGFSLAIAHLPNQRHRAPVTVDHLLKTFWGWRDKQLPDATLICPAPSWHTYVTTPGSVLLFPSLCTPIGDIPAPAPADADCCGDRTAMMPLRTTTRAQRRSHRIVAENLRNHRARERVSEVTPF